MPKEPTCHRPVLPQVGRAAVAGEEERPHQLAVLAEVAERGPLLPMEVGEEVEGHPQVLVAELEVGAEGELLSEGLEQVEEAAYAPQEAASVWQAAVAHSVVQGQQSLVAVLMSAEEVRVFSST